MEFKVKFLIVCAVVALAHSSPMPQEEVVETTTAGRPPRPNRPLINAITSAFQSMNSAFNLAQTALGSVTSSGYTVASNAAESANQFMASAANSFQSGINTVTNSVSHNVIAAASAWRPTEPPSIAVVDENGVPLDGEDVSVIAAKKSSHQ